MDISFDLGKRADTLKHRGLDFADAGIVFAGRTVTVQDERRAYGEDRFITAGHLNGRCLGAGLDAAARRVASFP